MIICVITVFAVAWCLSVTLVYCIQTAKDIVKLLSQPGSPHHYRQVAMCVSGKQEAQLMLTTGSTRLVVSRGQQTWYHSTCYIWFPIVQ